MTFWSKEWGVLQIAVFDIDTNLIPLSANPAFPNQNGQPLNLNLNGLPQGEYFLKVYEFTGFGDDYFLSDSLYSLCLNTSVGIPSFTVSEVMVFPNPAGSTLSIVSTQNFPLQLQLRALNGKILKDMMISTNELIDVRDLPSGLYLLEISNEYGITTKKFIKQ